MKVARLVILVFVVTLAMNAVGTSPTLASSPEFRVLPSTKTFSSTSGVSIMAAATTSLTCHAHTAKGEITSMDAVGKLVVTFNGCVVQTGSCTAKANSVTGKTGEIVTNRIRGLLGTVKTSEAASGVGLLFEPESGNTKFLTLAATACTPESTTNGNLAGEATPVDKLQKSGKLILTGIGDKQKIKEIVVLGRKVQPELEAFGGIASATATDEGEYREAIEIS